jgi:hypothetical protein
LLFYLFPIGLLSFFLKPYTQFGLKIEEFATLRDKMAEIAD